MIKDLLLNKDAKEKARIKSEEISKLNHIGKFKDKDLEIEILSVNKIQHGDHHGIAVMARAWNGEDQLGFGKDGTVEIERFRIWDPPVTIDDPNGEIIHEYINLYTKKLEKTREEKENPIEAIRNELIYSINFVGKKSGRIIKGKIGSTTDTFYSVAGSNTGADGNVAREGNQTWAQIHDGAGTAAGPSAHTILAFFCMGGSPSANTWSSLQRVIVMMDSSAIGTDDIISATLSGYGHSKSDGLSCTPNINVYVATPDSDHDIIASDFQDIGTTALCDTPIIYSNWNTADYNSFALNAAGIANISKIGVSQFGFRNVNVDVANTPPAWQESVYSHCELKAADEGDAYRPKLVVEHEGAAGATGNFFQLL